MLFRDFVLSLICVAAASDTVQYKRSRDSRMNAERADQCFGLSTLTLLVWLFYSPATLHAPMRLLSSTDTDC